MTSDRTMEDRARHRLVERVAKDMCWAGFSKKPDGHTRATYWRVLPTETRAAYRKDAEWVLWLLKNVPSLRALQSQGEGSGKG